MEINNFFELIISRKDDFQKKYKIKPKYLYIGKMELDQLNSLKTFTPRPCVFKDETPLTFLGIKIIKVIEETFLEFGF